MECKTTVLQRNLLEINPCATQHNATKQCNEKISEKYPRVTGAVQPNTTVLQENFTREKPKCNTMQCNTTVQREHFRDIPWRNKCNTMECNSARRKF